MAAFIIFRNRQNRQTDINVNMSDSAMRARYRFGNDNLNRLVEMLRPRIERPTQRSNALSVKLQLLITLRFLASGNFIQTVGDTFGVDKGTVSRILSRVINTLCDFKNTFIRFPTDENSLNSEKVAFFQRHGFPGVIGCIDCTHVRIISPPGPGERDFVNRKNYHSVNVQVTCDSKGVITSINAAWPGSTHDAHIFRVSRLCNYFEEYHRGVQDGVLLGDSGYPCRPFLLTPYLHPVTASQQHYNDALCRTRCCIERTFGVWKRRFHVLHAEIRMKPEKCSKVIVACAVLYNLAKLWGEPDVQGDEEIPEPEVINYNGRNDGCSVREHITNIYFH